jgi:hypothetical protein
VAIGTAALGSNTTASNNTAVGYQSLYTNTTGDSLVAVGRGTLKLNTTGYNSTAVGDGSLRQNTTGIYNSAFGSNALDANTTGSSNTSIGTESLYKSTTASYNTAVGYQALTACTTGQRNVAIGYIAGTTLTTGTECVFVGDYAGQTTSGSQNTFVGRASGYLTTSGTYNSFFGNFSGSNVTTGSKNSILGCYNGNQGSLDIRTSSNYIVLSDGDGNPRGFCNGARWYFGSQTASEYWPQTSSVNGYNAVSIDRNSGNVGITSNDVSPIYINRNNADGDLIRFYTTGTQQGSISVSGSTVSYNGGHLSRWSQLLDNSKDDTILKGTVMSNLDDMCVWEKDGVVAENEQLNKMKVSDVEGDTNVAGVFVNWTMDEQYGVDDINVAMTGDMIIRIAEGVVVQKGDLLMSAGNGTAKPQGDDIRRSKTVAKVTSNYVTCTYADGSYCVPCVLMAC